MRPNQITLLVLGLFLCGWLLALTTSLPQNAARHLAGFQIPAFSIAAALPEPRKTVKPAAIDVVFVLDTTGSMGGLIEGAKIKIWSIINHLNQYHPQPELRIGLVAYRDRSDPYITRHTPLSADLDAIYSDLMGFVATGGGDFPESVNQGLYEAVTQFQWKRNSNTLRMVFLVGDAPPHMNYENDIRYMESCRLAREMDILINTIQCGQAPETARYWTDIAQRGGGEYAAIEQSGGMVVQSAPQDSRIDVLNRAISATVLPYGDSKARDSARLKMDTAGSLTGYAAAERQTYLAESAPSSAITGDEDLVTAVESGRVTPATIKPSSLPDDYAKLDKAALEKEIQKRIDQRKGYQQELQQLLAERRKHLKSEAKAPAGKAAFDEQVEAIIRTQAATKNFTHSTPEG